MRLKLNQRKHTSLEEKGAKRKRNDPMETTQDMFLKRKPVNILWRQNLINNIKGFANVAKS